MKNKQFEQAIITLQNLFADLSKRNALKEHEIDKFNESQKSIIAYYNFINSVYGSVIYPWNDPKFNEAWDLWRLYKKQQFNFKYKSIAEQSSLKHLYALSNGYLDNAIAIINHSINSGYMGLFPEKKGSGKQKGTSSTYKQNLANRLIKNQQR